MSWHQPFHPTNTCSQVCFSDQTVSTALRAAWAKKSTETKNHPPRNCTSLLGALKGCYSRHASWPKLSLLRLFQHCEPTKAQPSHGTSEKREVANPKRKFAQGRMCLCRQAWKGCACPKPSITLHKFSAPQISCGQIGHANLSPPTNDFLLKWFAALQFSTVINAN